ncbi:MAG: glycosyltransferase family 4 protein [Syntrophobacteraceae bacterium]|jgi:glycosyltransferase involved in cell wall biosynthesis|nr:glycosyltransferase family 4 protein [Syntrophobacteraceae bacterium]
MENRIMKALVIAPQPFFTPRGTPFSVYYRTCVASELGVEIDLLTYGQGEDVDIPGVRIIRVPHFPALGNVKVGPSPLKILLDLLILARMVVLLAMRRYDLVHAHEEAVFFSRFLKPLFGFKLIYDMHSSLPQQLTNFNFTSSKALIGLFRLLENNCLKASDAVITICPDLARQVDECISDHGKHFLIENSIFDPVALKAGVSRSGSNGAGYPASDAIDSVPPEKPLLVYAGTLEPYQGIDLLIPAFKRVLGERPDTSLIIVGGSEPQVRYYRSMADRLGLDGHVQFTGRVAPEVARAFSRSASVLLSPRSEGTNTPLKVYEQLASGIPLVATDIYSHTQILNSDVAFLVKPDAEDMARGILEALAPDGRSREVAANARLLYEEKYSRKVYIQKMRQLLEYLA